MSESTSDEKLTAAIDFLGAMREQIVDICDDLEAICDDLEAAVARLTEEKVEIDGWITWLESK